MALTGARFGRRLAALAGAILLASISLDAHADQDPRWRWRTIETDHMRVHFPQGLDDIARRVARIAEETHTRLSDCLCHESGRITHWVLQDDTDYAQGITWVGPNNIIQIWPVGPEDGSELEDYDDWLTTLITHEYTHLTHIDNARGLPAIINAVFGHIYFPNQLAPRWLLEGYAIYEESSQTTGGRVRGSTFDMYLRAAILEGSFLRIDQVSGGTRHFPHGNVPYLYGQGFVDYLTRRFGPELLAELAADMGDEWLPYGLNRAFRRATGHTSVELYGDWQRSLEAGYGALSERLSEEGLTESTRLTHSGEWMRSPRWSADGEEIYVYHATEDAPSTVWAVDPDTGRRRRQILTAGNTSIAPSRDGRFIYYSRGDRHWVVYAYEDIFRHDLETGEEERLTDGARGHEPDISPDGRQLVFPCNRADAADLCLMGSDGGEVRRIIRSEHGEQIFTPRWSPDGRRLAMARWHVGGYRDIEILDVAEGTITRVTEDRHLDSSPSWSPDGRWLLFSSDRTGVSNIYAWDLERQELHQVTNVINGAFMPDLSPDGSRLAFAGFSAAGFDLHVMPFDPESFRAPQPERERDSSAQELPDVAMRERAYEPWATLAPRSWMIGIGQDSFGDALLLTTWGQDATAAHRFAGSMTVGTTRGDVGYDLSYELGMFRPNISLRTSRWVAPRSSYRVDTSAVDFIEETYLAAADISIYLGHGTYSHRLSAGWEVRYSRAAGGLPQVDYDPSGRPPRLPTLGLRSGLGFGWRFSNARSVMQGLSLEQGRSLALSMNLYHPAFGSDWFQIDFRYRWTEYIQMPWLQHHVLALSLGGGISVGELRTNSFYIGGYPDQDIVQSLLNMQHMGGHVLRGYPPGVIGGSQYHLLNVEYRFPLWDVEVGAYTLPLFLSHIWLAAFCDVGGAFGDTFDVEDLLVGAGGEILVRIVVGYVLPFTFRIGYAHGFMSGGADQLLFVLGLPY